MAKKKNTTVYKCSECNYVQPAWLGKCPNCGLWNTFEQVIDDSTSKSAIFNNGIKKITPVPLASISKQEDQRLITNIPEFDRVLGNGAMKRSAILLGGEPGIGKSTLLIQTASQIAKSNKNESKILYISGEESANQIKSRVDRLNISTNNIEILCTMSLEDIKEALFNINPIFVVIDSIQTVYSIEAGLIPGTINQLKYCANELISWVKERESVLIMSAHVTKEGQIAGPKSLEHMVDTVISFERNNDELRFLRATKNRFGSVDELGIFAMTEHGLEGVKDPSTMFITKRLDSVPAGIANTAVFEGSRAFLVEIQALTIPSKSSISRVYSDKIDSARVARVAAVLEKKLGINFSDQDIYINVAGGFRLTESSIDSALAAALYSARTDLAIEKNAIIVGEVSLAGEIRPVTRLKQRVKTAKDLGFNKIFVPETEPNAIKISTVKEMVKQLFLEK